MRKSFLTENGKNLVGVDMIIIANSILFIETDFSCDIKTHKY